MPTAKHAPWALLPCILLALSSVTLLAPAHSAPAAPQAAAYDDGDGDELLEHWGDPQFSREARLQMAGMAVLIPSAVLLMRRRRTRKAGSL